MVNKVEICGIQTAYLPKLTHDETIALILKAQGGDKSSRDEIIVANLRLVLSLIKRFKSKTKSVDDLFQAGCIGLIKSIDNFNVSYNLRFSTYAVPMIVGEIKRHLRDVNSMRISRSIRDRAYMILKTRQELEKNRDDSVGLEEIAIALNLKQKDVSYALDAISDTISLFDTVYNKNGDTLMLMDQIGDEKNTDATWTENIALSDAMEKLSVREKQILSLRYFEGKTQNQISDEVGISQAQVSRIEKFALKFLKQKIE